MREVKCGGFGYGVGLLTFRSSLVSAVSRGIAIYCTSHNFKYLSFLPPNNPKYITHSLVFTTSKP